MIIQFVATGIILIVLLQLVLKVMKDRTALVKLVIWLIFWGIALVLIWLPAGTLDIFGKFLGVGRGVDVLIYLSIIILFYTNFRLSNKIEKLEKNITILVREIAKKRVT